MNHLKEGLGFLSAAGAVFLQLGIFIGLRWWELAARTTIFDLRQCFLGRIPTFLFPVGMTDFVSKIL
jgi:hypothetical protein